MFHVGENPTPLFLFQHFEFTKQNFKHFAPKQILVSQNSTQSFIRVGQCAKRLKYPNFQAFSNSFCPNVYENGQKFGRFGFFRVPFLVFVFT